LWLGLVAAINAPMTDANCWLCFLFPVVEPDRQFSRIRLSEKTHDDPCDTVYNF